MTRAGRWTFGVGLGSVAVVASALGLLIGQGAHARRTIPRLPEAGSPDGVHGSGNPCHLVVIGDSVAAGVGLPHHGVSLAGVLAERFAADREVRRTVIAQSGLTAPGVCELIRGRAEVVSADVVVVSVGVNDTLALHSARRWERELDELLGAVTTRASGASVVLLGVPRMDRFAKLPWALRRILGIHSRRLDSIGKQVVGRQRGVSHLAMDLEGMDARLDLFAADGFHPSAAVHAELAARLHALILESGRS